MPKQAAKKKNQGPVKYCNLSRRSMINQNIVIYSIYPELLLSDPILYSMIHRFLCHIDDYFPIPNPAKSKCEALLRPLVALAGHAGKTSTGALIKTCSFALDLLRWVLSDIRLCRVYIKTWLVVWNIFYFPIYWE